MSFRQKLLFELEELALASFYFLIWLGTLLVLKKLTLEDYQIQIRGFSAVLVGVLILAKVVLVLEHVPFGSWIQGRPAVVDVVLRTALYGLGVLIVLVLEKAFEARHEHGGFVHSLGLVFQHPDMPHVWTNTIVVTGALLGFNALSVIRRHLGEYGLFRLFISPPPDEPSTQQPQRRAGRGE